MSKVIYALVDPRDKQAYYIGQTRYSFERKNNWLAAAKRGQSKNPRLMFWFESLMAAGLQPDFVILEHVTNEKITKAEKRWIQDGMKCGWPLCNMQVLDELKMRRILANKIAVNEATAQIDEATGLVVPRQLGTTDPNSSNNK